MTALPVLLLPGLDGTGDLFEPLVATAPKHLRPVVVSLPQLSAYDELLEGIRSQLPATGRFAIVGESFSGPLAVAVAREQAERVAGVILCNSFLSPPRTRTLRFFPWSLLFFLPPPKWAIRRFLTGRSDLASTVRAAIAKTPRRLLAGRMRAVFLSTRAESIANQAAGIVSLRDE
jgi:pimeloyl-ACP methyl ester carboxylesterase